MSSLRPAAHLKVVLLQPDPENQGWVCCTFFAAWPVVVHVHSVVAAEAIEPMGRAPVDPRLILALVATSSWKWFTICSSPPWQAFRFVH